MCLQAENNSFLELRLAFCGLKIISNFSVTHRLQVADTGENGAALPTISKFVSYATFSSFNFQMYVDKVVAFLVFWFTKSLLCFWYLFLNSPAVIPT